MDWPAVYRQSDRAGKEAFWKKAGQEPVFYAEAVLGITLWKRQQDIIKALVTEPRVGVKSCHASGKSFTAAVGVCWFLHTRKNVIVATTAPTFRQVEKVLWGEVRGMWKRVAERGFRAPGRLYSTEIKIDDKWYAFGFSTDDPDRFQGLHAEEILVVLDEASGIHSDLWPGIEGVLSGGLSRLLMIGNPTDPTSQFAREYSMLPASARFTISAFDTPNLKAGRTQVRGLITPEWVEDKKRRWGVSSPLYQSRVLGEFPPAAPDSLIHLTWIERAQNLWRDIEDEKAAQLARGETPVEPPAELGCDIAWEGDDNSVFAVKRGRQVQIVLSENGLDTMETAGRAIALARELKCEPKVDSIGIGAGVVGRIREEGITCHAMNAAEGALDDETFLNLRAEWFWQLREAFEEGRIALDPEDTETANELLAIKYKYTGGRIRIEPKDEIKKRLGGMSPDRADAVMLAWAKPVSRTAHAPVVDAVAIGMPPVVIPPT